MNRKETPDVGVSQHDQQIWKSAGEFFPWKNVDWQEVSHQSKTGDEDDDGVDDDLECLVELLIPNVTSVAIGGVLKTFFLWRKIILASNPLRVIIQM